MYDQNERIVGSNEQINDKYKEMTIRQVAKRLYRSR